MIRRSSIVQSFVLAVGAAILAGWSASPVAAQVNYSTYQEAYSAGARAINAGKLAAARAPLEAAANLAKTDREKIEVHRALMIPYRELQEIEPMQRAAEYVLANSKQAAERSLTRGSLLSFIHKRDKMDVAIEGYEARLKKMPEDATVLFVLTEAYATYKKDPGRSAELAEKLAVADKKLGRGQDVYGQAQLASQYIKAGKVKEGAELYEKIAPLDGKMTAWHYKEAATAWLKAGDKGKALAAAKKSDAAEPEKRTELLTHFWHKALGDVYLDAGDAKAAVPHYEKAISTTKIAGYVKDCEASLAKAKAAAGQ